MNDEDALKLMIPPEMTYREVNMTANANTNYISLAQQVPLWEMLERLPKGMQLGMEMKDTDGTIYGHSHTPIGLHLHEAAALLKKYESALRKLAYLGNGDKLGNSHGNAIAQEALGMHVEIEPIIVRSAGDPYTSPPTEYKRTKFNPD